MLVLDRHKNHVQGRLYSKEDIDIMIHDKQGSTAVFSIREMKMFFISFIIQIKCIIELWYTTVERKIVLASLLDTRYSIKTNEILDTGLLWSALQIWMILMTDSILGHPLAANGFRTLSLWLWGLKILPRYRKAVAKGISLFRASPPGLWLFFANFDQGMRSLIPFALWYWQILAGNNYRIICNTLQSTKDVPVALIRRKESILKQECVQVPHICQSWHRQRDTKAINEMYFFFNPDLFCSETLQICLSVCLPTYSSIYLSIYPPIYLSVYLSISLSVSGSDKKMLKVSFG